MEKWQEGASTSDIGQALGTMDDVHLDDLDMEAVDESAESADGADSNGDDDAPIVRFVNKMLLDAIRLGASDIHFEPYEKTYRVRFRVDGSLREVVQPHRALHAALISRLKIMAELDIAEKRLPQDGRISLRIGGRAVDVRVSTLPNAHGERAVLRLLDKENAGIDLAALGIAPASVESIAPLYLEGGHGLARMNPWRARAGRR